MDWDWLHEQCGGTPHYCDRMGLRAIELVAGEEFVREATLGVIALHPQWLLMEGVLRILESETAVSEAYRIYANSDDPFVKGRCVALMREIPNSLCLGFLPALLEDSSEIAVAAAQMLEKQIWYNPALEDHPQFATWMELVDGHADPHVRAEGVEIRGMIDRRNGPAF